MIIISILIIVFFYFVYLCIKKPQINKLYNNNANNIQISPKLKGGFNNAWQDKKNFKEINYIISKVNKIYKKYDIPLIGFYGTLLGIIRHNGEFIPWDDDSDFLVSYDKFHQNFDNIKKDLQNCGIDTIYNKFGFWKHSLIKNPRIKSYDWSYPFVDIFLQRKNGNIDGDSNLDGKIDYLDTHNTHITKLYNHKIRIPNNYNHVLNESYGDDWKTTCIGLNYIHEIEENADDHLQNKKEKCSNII